MRGEPSKTKIVHCKKCSLEIAREINPVLSGCISIKCKYCTANNLIGGNTVEPTEEKEKGKYIRFTSKMQLK